MKRLVVAALAMLLAAQVQAAEVSRIVVGFPPGQATDIIARLIAERIAPILGETFIVENRPGQGGSIALAALANTQADGRTMVLAPLASMVANPHLYKSVGYDTLKDFAPVALICDLPMPGSPSSIVSFPRAMRFFHNHCTCSGSTSARLS